MKRLSTILFAVVFGFITVGMFSSCSVTDALDLVLENEELISRNAELEAENQELKDYIEELESQLGIVDSDSSESIEESTEIAE